MPLVPGQSREVIDANIREMVRAGHPQRQAVAAALDNSRRHPRAIGGGIAAYDDGGVIDPSQTGIGGIVPSAQTANPFVQGMIRRFAAMPTEKLQETASRVSTMPGGSAYTPIIQTILRQRLLMPNLMAAQPPAQSPDFSSPVQPQRRGGTIRRATGGELGISASQASPWWTRQEAYGMDHSGFLRGSTMGRADALRTSAASGAYVIPADVVVGLGDGNSLAGARIMDAILRTGPFGTLLPRGRLGRGPPSPPGGARMFPEAKGGGVQGDARGKPVPVLLSHGEYVISIADVRRIGGGNLLLGHKALDRFVERQRARHIEKLKHLPGPVKETT